MFADRFCWLGRVGVSDERRCPREVSLPRRTPAFHRFLRQKARASERVSSRFWRGKTRPWSRAGVKARRAIAVISRDLEGFAGDSGACELGDWVCVLVGRERDSL